MQYKMKLRSSTVSPRIDFSPLLIVMLVIILVEERASVAPTAKKLPLISHYKKKEQLNVLNAS